jgi:multiple sugar transport system permease protein
MLCIMAGLVFLAPVIWLLVGSFWPSNAPISDLARAPLAFRPTFENYAIATTLVPMGRFAMNSLRIVLIAVPLSLLVASLAGFAMTQLPERARVSMLWLSLAALMAPSTALWLARFPLFKALGWIDTPLPLIAPALLGGSPLFVLIFYWSFRRLSVDLVNAARLDGANSWRIWWSICLPSAPAAVVGVTILSVLLFWSNFTDPLLYLRSQEQMTMPIGVRLLAQLDPTQWPVLLAGGVLLTLPVLAISAVGLHWLGLEDMTVRGRKAQSSGVNGGNDGVKH